MRDEERQSWLKLIEVIKGYANDLKEDNDIWEVGHEIQSNMP